MTQILNCFFRRICWWCDEEIPLSSNDFGPAEPAGRSQTWPVEAWRKGDFFTMQ